MPISPDTPIDLQMHTTYSDGRWSAEQLFDYLAEEFPNLHCRCENIEKKRGRGRVLVAQEHLPLPCEQMLARFRAHGSSRVTLRSREHAQIKSSVTC